MDHGESSPTDEPDLGAGAAASGADRWNPPIAELRRFRINAAKRSESGHPVLAPCMAVWVDPVIRETASRIS
jgi:hypothetical protein